MRACCAMQRNDEPPCVGERDVAGGRRRFPNAMGPPVGGAVSYPRPVATFIGFPAMFVCDDSFASMVVVQLVPAMLDKGGTACLVEVRRGMLLLSCLQVYGVSNPKMANYSRFWMETKDGVIGGYQSFTALVPELKFGMFLAMSTGGPTCVTVHAAVVLCGPFVLVPLS